MDMPLKQALISAANAIDAAAALALSNAQRALSDAERHAAFAKGVVGKIKAAQEAEEMPSAVLDVSASDLCTCDVCGLPCRGGANAQGFCGSCAHEYDNALKEHPEEVAACFSADALRLLILRLSAETIRQDEELHDVYYGGAKGPGNMEAFLNEHAEELLERLPASFAPWWKDRWTHEKWCEMAAARKAAGWAFASADAPLVQRLAAMFVAEQGKVEEMEARHQRELEEAWEAGALQGGQDMEGVMKHKLEELEAEHKKQMAAITEASAEASNAVGEAAEKIRHDAKRRGYADGYAFADQKATKVIQAMRADLEAARKEGENHQAGYIRLIGERDEAVLEVVDLRQELDASAEAKEKLEAEAEALRKELDREVTAATRVFNAMESDLDRLSAENKALKAAAAANYQAGYSAAEEKFRAEFQELRKCRADATEVFQAMRADLERLSAENKALRQQIEEDKQMVQRHLKEVAEGHAEATTLEKEEIERLRKDVRAHEARVAWHADMAKRDMEAITKGHAEIKGLEAQVADHSRWRDEANHAASVAELEAKKLRTKLAEVDWDKEQLLKAVEALRELVGPTQKLMASNPELFGGEALPPVGMSSPHPPPIVRLRQPLSEQQKRLLMAFKVLVPYECILVEPTEEQTPAEMPCMAATKVEADAVQSLPRPPPPSPILVPDQPTMCTAAGCIVCPPAEPVAEQTRICCVGCGKPKPDYNNPRWPSPRTKRFAKHIATHSGKDPKTIKTHESALEFLAQRAKISVDALLKMEMRDYQTAHAPWSITGIYGPDDRSVFYMG
jgi:hypothetical protein